MKTHAFKPLVGSIGPICQLCSLHEHSNSHSAPFGEDIVAELVDAGKDAAVTMIDYSDGGCARSPAIDQAMDIAYELPEGSEERRTVVIAAARAMVKYLTVTAVIHGHFNAE